MADNADDGGEPLLTEVRRNISEIENTSNRMLPPWPKLPPGIKFSFFNLRINKQLEEQLGVA